MSLSTLPAAPATVDPPAAPIPEEVNFLDALSKRLEEVSTGLAAPAPPDVAPEPKPKVNPDTGALLPDIPKGPLDDLIPKTELTPDDKADYKWKELRESNDAAVARAKDLEAQVEEMRKKVAAYDIETTEEFKSKVQGSFDRIQGLADKIASSYDAEKNDVYAAITEKNRRKQSEMIQDISEGWPERDRQELYSLARSYEDTLAVRDEMRTNADQALKTLREEDARRAEGQSEARKAQLKASDQKVFDLLKSRLSILSGDQGEALSNSLRERAASSDVTSDPDKLVLASYATLLLPEYAAAHSSLLKEVKELKDALQGLGKAIPGTGHQPGTPAPVEEGLSLVEALNRRVASGR